MICEGEYLCSNNAEPNKAFFVCSTLGCNRYALLCSKSDCQCQPQHYGHSILHLYSILNSPAVRQQLPLPEPVIRLEKNVEMLIDELIGGME